MWHPEIKCQLFTFTHYWNWLFPEFIFILILKSVKVTQLCPALCNTMDYTVHGILQARILEWVAFPFSRGSSQPRDWAQVSSIAGRFFTSWTTMEAHSEVNKYRNYTYSFYIIFSLLTTTYLPGSLCLWGM